MRFVDLVFALLLAVVAVGETLVVGAGHSDGFNAVRAALAAATVLTLAVRRTAPALMAFGFAAGMTIESLATESPDQIAVLLGAVLAAYSVSAHAPTMESLLGTGVLSLAVTVTIALDPSDELSNVAPTLALFILLPAAFGFAWANRGRIVSDLAARAEAAEAALAAEREGAPRGPSPSLPLTKRQHDVVLLIARGFSNREIAAALHLSENTIKGYVSEILMQHNLRDRTQLVIRAYKSGVVRAANSDL